MFPRKTIWQASMQYRRRPFLLGTVAALLISSCSSSDRVAPALPIVGNYALRDVNGTLPGQAVVTDYGSVQILAGGGSIEPDGTVFLSIVTSLPTGTPPYLSLSFQGIINAEGGDTYGITFTDASKAQAVCDRPTCKITYLGSVYLFGLVNQ